MLFASLGMGPLIDRPTRISATGSATLLDHIYSNQRHLTGFIIESDVSDHYCTGLYPDKFNKRKHIPTERIAPLHDNRSLKYLRKYLQCVNWESVTNDNSTSAFNKFNAIMEEANLICCPPVSTKLRSTPKELWFIPGLLRSRYVKEKLYRKCRQKNTPENWSKYRNYRNCYNRCLRSAKVRYYNQEFDKTGKN
jgi:hypothetical protein